MNSPLRNGARTSAIRFALLVAATLIATLLIVTPSPAASGGIGLESEPKAGSAEGGAYADARLLPSGEAIAPAGAPTRVKRAIAAANRIRGTKYVWGGGHGSFESRGYDCSGAVSYMLHGAGMLSTPLDSGSLASWGRKRKGRWITLYANSGHVYAVIAGLRWDTSGGPGPRWHEDMRSSAGFTVRHPNGY